MNTVDLTGGVEQAWAGFMAFLPKLLVVATILVVGYFIAKFLARALGALLSRVGFDRLAERGGMRRVFAHTRHTASELLAKLLFYAVFLFVLQFAFGVFGPNPISTMLDGVIAFLPNLFAAVLIVIVASAAAAFVKDILLGVLGEGYGRWVANLAAAFIITTGIFAGLNQIHIAPAIVNGLFYAMLAIIVGSAIVAIGGGGIVPMRNQWEKAIGRVAQEAPRFRERAEQMHRRAQERGTWKQEAQESGRRSGEHQS